MTRPATRSGGPEWIASRNVPRARAGTFRRFRASRSPRGSRQSAVGAISCLMTKIGHSWMLEPAGEGCLVRVRVDVPEAEAGKWLEQQREEIRSSLPRLVAAAEKAAAEL